MTYVANSGLYGPLGDATVITDNTHPVAGTLGVNYQVASNTITATLDKVPANNLQKLRFKVTIASGKATGTIIDNTAAYEWDTTPGDNLTLVSKTTGKASYTVGPSPDAVRNPPSVSSVTDSTSTINQGGQLTFTNTITNNNTLGLDDNYNITYTGSTFPAGTRIEFLDASGNLLMNTNSGDTIPDTGIVLATPGTPITKDIKVRVTLPTTTTQADLPVAGWVVNVYATSVADSTKTAFGTDTFKGTVTPNTVDVTTVTPGTTTVVGTGATGTTSVATYNTAGGQCLNIPVNIQNTAALGGNPATIPPNYNKNARCVTIPTGTHCSVPSEPSSSTGWTGNMEWYLDQVNSSATGTLEYRVQVDQ